MMNTDEKIYHLKIKLTELKRGAHVSPASFNRLLKKAELKKLYQCWYDEKPLNDIVIPDAVIRYEALINIAYLLFGDIIKSNFTGDLEPMVNNYDAAINDAIIFLQEEQQRDPNLYLWFDFKVAETSAPFIIPSPIGMHDSWAFGFGNGLSPSSASLDEKVAALEATIKNVSDRYESKAFEPFMT